MMQQSPEEAARMAEIKKQASAISGEIWTCPNEGVIVVKLATDNPQAKEIVDNLLSQLPQQFATQLNVFFGIRGKIIKKKAIFNVVETIPTTPRK